MSSMCEVCGEVLDANAIKCPRCEWYVRRNSFFGGSKDLDIERVAWAKQSYQFIEKLDQVREEFQQLEKQAEKDASDLKKSREHEQELIAENDQYKSQVDKLKNEVLKHQRHLQELKQDTSTYEDKPALDENELTRRISHLLNQSSHSQISHIEQRLNPIVQRLEMVASVFELLKGVDKKVDHIPLEISRILNQSYSEAKVISQGHEAELRNQLLARRSEEPPSQLDPTALRENLDSPQELEQNQITTEAGTQQLEPPISASSDEPQSYDVTHPLSQEEQYLVDSYSGQRLVEDHCRYIEQTQESIEERLSGRGGLAIFEERRRSQYYWLVQGTEQQYLVPKSDLALGDYALRSLKSLFKTEGELDSPHSFQLIKPGRLQSTQDGKWELIEMGVLHFSRQESDEPNP